LVETQPLYTLLLLSWVVINMEKEDLKKRIEELEKKVEALEKKLKEIDKDIDDYVEFNEWRLDNWLHSIYHDW